MDKPESEVWDERYAASDRLWSGDPNGALVAEVAGLTPGRALDIGCGEGADAVWLARQGWTVTGLDVSPLAIGRATQHGRDAGVDVRWIASGFVDADLVPGTFDLVSAMYAVLAHTPEQTAERLLLDLVAPGGTLLVVHHVMDDEHKAHARESGFDPDDYVSPGDVLEMLGDDWVIEVDEVRDRHVATGAGAGHVQDVLVRATLKASR